MNLGIKLQKKTKQEVSLIRTTLESEINLLVEEKKRRPYKIDTGIAFFNHMLTGVASRACFNLDVSYKNTEAESLDHVITEDTGLTLGRAIRELLDSKQPEGVNQRGTYTVAFDEALVTVTLAYDGRSYCYFSQDCPGLQTELTEGIASTNLRQFFEGFAQGAGCVVHVQAWTGQDSHHTWEATFKAFGEALRESLSSCSYRAGTTVGLKGTGLEKTL